MSVRYFLCTNCGDVGSDHDDEWKTCGKCPNEFCCNACAEESGLNELEDGGKTGIYSNCGFCRGEKFTDNQLLDIALTELKLSKEELIEFAKNK